MTASRVTWVDGAKGAGILLVVFGHAVLGLQGAGLIGDNGFWADLNAAIYTFHMPLFFLLSGLFVSGRLDRNRPRFFSGLFALVIWPMILWSDLQTVVMWAANGLINHHDDTSLSERLLRNFFDPGDQFWFLADLALFQLAMAAAHAMRILRPVSILGVVFCMALLIGRGGENLTWFSALFFLLGVAAPGLVHLPQVMPLREGMFTSVLVFVPCVIALIGFGTPPHSWSTVPAALAGCGFVIFLSACSGPVIAVLSRLGRLSMPIYVMHILFCAPLRILLLHAGLTSVPVLLAVLLAVGVLGPLAAFAVLDRFNLAAALGLERGHARRPALHTAVPDFTAAQQA
jgi:fucose 4-O-acetylase-like acetyltransferase